MPIYADYLSINQDFQPVFSQEEDRLHPDAWKGFIPHDAWVKVLDALVRSLERASGPDRRPLLLHGAYGTGKTFATFVLKHMLEDDWPAVQSYIESRPDLQQHPDLCRRLQQLRQSGNYLVVFRSGSAHVTNSFILLAQIQEGVRQALASRGMALPVTDTLYQAVLAKLDAPDSSLNWVAVFRRHRARFADCPGAESVVHRLRSGAADGSNADLMSRVYEVLSAEGFAALGDPDGVKSWLEEVIKAAGLAGIIFMWDEFTEYFRQNRSTSTLQELAHLTTRVPFYLFLVTHKSPEIAGQFADPADWKRLIERFIAVPYDMAVVTAYKLMAGAISINPGRRDDWEGQRDRIWGWVALSAGQLAKDGREGERREDFRALLPIHPYTAFLLSTISRQFSSSQRTLFRWLKEDESGAFPRFLRQELSGDGPLLTAESLWDYFFLDENLDLADKVRDIVSYYRSRADGLEGEEERRALRAVLLLLALERQMGQVDPRLRPRQQNIVHMLVGTGQAQEVVATIAKLVERDVVRQLPGDSKEYTIAAGDVDHERVRRLEEGLPKFETLAHSTSAGQSPVADEVRRRLTIADGTTMRRLRVVVVPAAYFLARGARLADAPPQPYQLGVVVVVGLDDEELRRAETLAEGLSPTLPRTVFAVSSAAFGGQRWQDWRRERAHEQYYTENRDAKNAKVHADRAARLVAAWGEQLRSSSIRVTFRDLAQAANGASGCVSSIEAALDTAYPNRLERVWPTATLYKDNYGASGASIGLGVAQANANPYKDVVAGLSREGLWAPATYRKALERDSDHPLALLQRAVDEEFASGRPVSLRELWQRLQGEPFGLLPSPIAILVLGLLLRDYCDGYYRRDGITSSPLTRPDLADRLNTVMHGRDDTVICRMSMEAQQFCQTLADIFAVAPGQADYPDRAQKAARAAVQRLGYPFWLLRLGEGSYLAASVGAIETLLADTSGTSAALDEASLAGFNRAVKPRQVELRRRLSATSFETAMRGFLDAAEPRALAAASKLGLGLVEVMTQLKALLQQEVWLWREAEVRERLPELAGRLELTLALNELGGGRDRDLDGAMVSLRERLRQGKLPLTVLAGVATAGVAGVIARLERWLSRQGQQRGASEVAEGLLQHKEEVRRVLASPESALLRWANAELQLDLGEDDARELWRHLGDFSDRPDLHLRQEVRRLAGEVQRSRAAMEVLNSWRHLTGAASPQEWGRQHGVPIEWLCDSPELLDAVGRVDHLHSQSQAELERLSGFLDERAGWLRGMGDEASVHRVYAGLLPEFDGVLTNDDLQMVKQRLQRSLGPDLGTWRRDAAREAALDAVRSSYVERLLPRVEVHIDSLPADEAKRLLRELARDPALGLRLLKRKGQQP